jgi:long-chain fatty acid transport protein
MVWGDNWAGATHIQEVSLKAFNIQPTVSYKINDFISVGAGLMIDFGSFSQEKGLVAANSFAPLGALAGQLAQMNPAFSSLGALPGMINSFSNQVPVGIELEGSSKVALGFNVGVLFNVSPKVTIGATYRSKVKLSVENGEAELDYVNDNAEAVVGAIKGFDVTPLQGILPQETLATIKGTQTQLATMGMLDGAKFEASMPIPAIFSVGIAYQPNAAWTITGEAQITGWSAYDKLDITFKTAAGEMVQSSVKDYENTVAIRLGAQYVVSDFWTVRAGAYMDTPPVQMDNYNPETPSANSYGVTAGATLNPMKNLAIDLSVGYLRGEKTTGSYQNGTFVADYTKSAIMPGIGVRFNF